MRARADAHELTPALAPPSLSSLPRFRNFFARPFFRAPFPIARRAVPIVFVIVGVGDGPWTGMEKLDDSLEGRKFDNVNFVELAKVAGKASEAKIGVAGALAMECLSELPQAFKDCTRLGMFRKQW